MPVLRSTLTADCMAPASEGAAEEHTWNGVTWSQTGSTLSWTSPAKTEINVGVVSDIKESSPENLENLKAFVGWFKTSKADFIIVDGDSGTENQGIIKAWETLLEAGVPVFVIIGNGEGRMAYNSAIAAVRAKAPQLFDLGKVRRIHTPEADFVSLPGYFNADFIHSADGCQYFASDVEATAAILKSAPADKPRVLVSHGGPQQSGLYAVDRTTEAKFVGDPAMAKLIKDNNVGFGIFGNVHEAGGHGTDVDGNALIAEKTKVASLYLNPGPSDAVTWLMNDKSESVGMASILTIGGGQASYEMMRRSGGKIASAAEKPGKGKLKKKGK